MDELDLAMLDCFGTGAGKIVLDFLTEAYFERPMFDMNDVNPQALAFREGQRSVILDIRAAIRRAQEPFVEEPQTDTSKESNLSQGDILDLGD